MRKVYYNYHQKEHRMKRVTFTLDDDLHRKLKAYTTLAGENISTVLRLAAIEYIKEHEESQPKYTTLPRPGLKPRRIRHK
jgi:alkyl hydroperoxide reductase subunit AhpC